jgi:diguanylate cyclase (GGDEF)-like protein
MAIPPRFEASIREFQDYVEDVRRSNFLTFSDALARLMSLFGPSTDLSEVSRALGAPAGFDDWYSNLQSSATGTGGHGQVSWPQRTKERLAFQLELLRRIDDNKIDFTDFCRTYLTISGKYDDMVHALSEHVVRQFARDFVRFVHSLGQSGVSLAAARLVAPVTKLPTRDQLQEGLSRRLASGDLVSVVFIDLDNFKALNDSQGHAAGDVCLEDVNVAISASIHQKGELFRYGGDEFAVVLPNFDEAEANSTAARILSAVRSAGQSVGVTASIGVATSEAGMESDVLIARADKAMYVSKRSSKDTVTGWSPAIDKQVVSTAADR